MALSKTRDHWAFLEEIEAPMWVDLTLEGAQSNSQDIDDEWFCTSHLFHQCSSHQLKAAFSRAGGESVDLDCDLLGASSPKIPSSVSRSRGKHYRRKIWRGDNCNVTLNKPHTVKVLSGNSSLVDSGSCEKFKRRSGSMKPKSSYLDLGSGKKINPKLSFVNPKGTSNLKRSLVCERSSIGNSQGNFLKIKSIGLGLDSSSSSMVAKMGESNTGSTVTSESSLQNQQKFLEVSSQAFGQTSGLLSAVRIALRKSCITRQASRVENKNDRRQSTLEINKDGKLSKMEVGNDRSESGDQKSSSSKSSVGSSSVPRFNVKNSMFISTRKKEKTPDSRHVARKSEAPANRVKVCNISKGSAVQVKEGLLNSRKGDKTTVAKSNSMETAKSKVETLHAKSSLPLKVNQQKSFAGAVKGREKVESGRVNRLLGGGKENAGAKVFTSEKYNGRKNAAGSIRGQNVARLNVQQKGDTRGLVCPKVESVDRERKNSVHVHKRVYLR